MEHTLRCNHLKCRRELSDHAVVTTCSHIFCIDCSNHLQLSGQHRSQRPICPACDQHLLNPDDVVITNLNPTDDYKTSVLSGLNPNVIMECAGRALSFWAYQTTQEIVYQEYLARSLTDKCAALHTQMDKIVHDANGEISSLRARISRMQLDQDGARRKNEELVHTLREKSRKQLQAQELYDKLKRRTVLDQAEGEAFNAVGNSIQAPITFNRSTDTAGSETQHPPAPPFFCNSQRPGNGIQYPAALLPKEITVATPNNTVPIGENGWAGFSSQGTVHRKTIPYHDNWLDLTIHFSENQSMQTPSTHRQRLGLGASVAAQAGAPNVCSTGNMLPTHQRSIPRQPLAPLTQNSSASPGFAGYGMSAGLKVSNMAATPINGPARLGIRSRGGFNLFQRRHLADTKTVAQRPSPRSKANFIPVYGPSPASNIFSRGENCY